MANRNGQCKRRTEKVFSVRCLILSLILIGCTQTIVTYDEEEKDFVVQKGKAQEGAIVIEEGDNCQVVDDIFVVCGQ